MLPALPALDVSDRVMGYAVERTKLLLLQAPCANVSHDFRGDPGAVVIDPMRHPMATFPVPVGRIVLRRPNEQVSGVNASPVVAVMTNERSRRDRASVQLIRESVRPDLLPTVHELSVALLRKPAGPQPALRLAALSDTGPELLFGDVHACHYNPASPRVPRR
jgi:hypothetical protein